MGYMGLNHYNDSDDASDFVANICDAIGNMCLKELKNKANEYNTSGDVNIALFAESFLKNVPIYRDSPLYKALKKCRDMLENKLEQFVKNTDEDWEDRDMHIKAYKRMRNFLTRKIDEAY